MTSQVNLPYDVAPASPGTVLCRADNLALPPFWSAGVDVHAVALLGADTADCGMCALTTSEDADLVGCKEGGCGVVVLE